MFHLGATLEPFALPLMVGYIGQVVNPIFRISTGPVAPVQVSGHASDAAGVTGVKVDHRGRGEDEVLLERAEDADVADDEDIGLPLPDGHHLTAVTLGDRPAERGVSGGRAGGKDRAVGGRPLAPGEVRGYITLIARMAVSRCGTLLWRKGLDLEVSLAMVLIGQAGER